MKLCESFSRFFGLVIGIATVLAAVLNIFELIIHLSNNNICFRILEFIFDNYNPFTIIYIVLYIYEFKYYLVSLQFMLLCLLSYVIWIYRKQPNSEKIGNKLIIVAIINIPVSLFILYVLIVIVKTANVPNDKIFTYYEENILHKNQSKSNDLAILDFAQNNECNLDVDIYNSTQQSCLDTLEENVNEIFRYVTHVTIFISVTFAILGSGFLAILKMKRFLKEKQQKRKEEQKQQQQQHQQQESLDSESEQSNRRNYSSLNTKIKKPSSSEFDSDHRMQWSDSDYDHYTNYM